MEITEQQLDAINGITTIKAATFAGPLAATFAQYNITTPARICAFMGQVLEESGHLIYTQELASGAEYEGRKDLGNTQPGDGRRYKGRGLIQITGKANYSACSVDLFGDKGKLLMHPELLEAAEWAARSAGWFWNKKSLNNHADQIDFSKPIALGDNLFAYKQITKLINGGLTHLDLRMQNYQEVKAALFP